MARPQTGLLTHLHPHRRALVYRVRDLPMTAMSVGQFSVWIPGLAQQMLREQPGKKLTAWVGFGYLFWLLAWHGKRPRRFQPHDPGAAPGSLDEGEGDLWVFLSSDEPSLIDRFKERLQDPLETLAHLASDRAGWNPDPETERKEPPPDIWIPESEPDFTRGCFVLQWNLTHPAESRPLFGEALRAWLARQGLEPQTRIESLTHETGTLVLLFHQDPEALDTALEEAVQDGERALPFLEPSVQAEEGLRFFIPSLDVLTGLRQGGIRLNRFSPTQQWNQ